MVDPSKFTVYGEPSAEAREAMSGFSPNYLGTFGGFVR